METVYQSEKGMGFDVRDAYTFCVTLENDLTSLSLDFPISKRGIIIHPTPKSCEQ